VVLNRPINYLHGFGAVSLRNVSISICTCFIATHSKLFFQVEGGFEVFIFQRFYCIQDFHNGTTHFNQHRGGIFQKEDYISFQKYVLQLTVNFEQLLKMEYRL
jgi:hypothetical protein